MVAGLALLRAGGEGEEAAAAHLCFRASLPAPSSFCHDPAASGAQVQGLLLPPAAAGPDTGHQSSPTAPPYVVGWLRVRRRCLGSEGTEG